MVDILRDPLWQFIGATLAFIAISVSITIYVLQKKKKSLSYEIINKSPLLFFREELGGKFKLFYEDKLIKNVLSIIIRFYNSGNQPIMTNDFEREITIKFIDNSNLLSAEVIKTEPDNLDAKIMLKNINEISLAPLLLNPKDSITVRSLITESDGKFNLDYRIVGINKINEGSHGQWSSFFLITFGLIISIAGIIWMIPKLPEPETFKPGEALNNTFGFISIGIGYLMMLIGINLNKRYLRIFRNIIRKYVIK